MVSKKKKSKSKHNKYAEAQKEKLSAGDFFVGFGKLEMFSFCVGFLIVMAAIFMIVAFISYLFTGEADFSLLEQSTDPLNMDHQYKNACGSLGAIIAFFFLNDLFGLASFVIPPYMIILGLRLMRIFKFTLIRKFILFTLLMLWASVFLAAFGHLFPYFDGSFIKLGGNHGIHVVKILTQVVGTPGLLVFLVIYAVLYLIYLSAKTIEVIRNAFRLNFLKKMHPERFKRFVDTDDEMDEDDYVRLRQQEEDGEEDETDEDDDDSEDEEEVEEEKGTSTTVLNFDNLGGNDDAAEDEKDGEDDAENFPNIIAPVVSGQNDLVQEGNAEENATLQVEVNVTDKGDGDIVRGDINRIIHVLKNFGVEIASIKATIGPTITLYEIVPAEGTRISKIRNLEDDIALSLAAEGIRIIAPIPGKGTIGIEVPNKKKSIVSMESLISSRVYQESKMELPCAVGKTISNDVFMFDLAKAPHLLVAGATGQGKSVGLNAIVTSLLYKKHPSELKIVMVDPKKVEFSIYSPIENHFLARLEEEEDCIITDVQKVVKTLNSLCQLMDTRYDLLKRAHVRNIKEYNEKFKNRQLNPEHGHEYMPYIVVIVDEFGDLIMTAGKEVELPICRIAQLARAVGIHMIIATQRPQASIISGAIKTNFPTRIAFKVASMMDSRVILDRGGANQLIGKGDMLYLQGGEPVRVQCAFVDTPEVNDICHYIASQQGFLHPMYLPEVLDAEGDGGGGMGTVDKGHLDPMFGDVAKFVVNNQSGSTSMIQRNFSIGYNRAGKIMDQLEKMGVVGAQVGSKPREVIIKDPLTLEGLLNTL